MSVGVRVLRPENGPDLEDAWQISIHSQLLVDLRRLRQRCGLAKVVRSEDLCAPLAFAKDELRGVDLDESPLRQGLSEDPADCCLHPHDGVVRWHAQVEPTTVEPQIRQNPHIWPVRFLGCLDVCLAPLCIRKQEGQSLRGFCHAVGTLYLQLHVGLRAACHVCLHQDPADVDEALKRQSLEELRDCRGALASILLALKLDGLHCVQAVLPEHHESCLALDA
mmetsp:Transcript_62037/g.134584  ORF Transcript_62037/g.134584 Transcript_62037/m.134584 type:complete len:222 (-) Transcript_62037:496-1161(-)